MIQHRTTVFEENLMILAKKLRLSLSDPVPAGHRATWTRRHMLAKAKLHSEINPGTLESNFPEVLASDRGGTTSSDFIEAHIFGPINSHTIEALIGPVPKTREDRLIWSRLERQLTSLGIRVEAV